MIFEEIFKVNELWVKKKLKEDSKFFENLSQGQNPEIVLIVE
jgi:carbonic anhydrase